VSDGHINKVIMKWTYRKGHSGSLHLKKGS